LIEESGGLVDFLLEFAIVGEIGLNFLEVQIDEHTGDLGGELLALDLLHKVEDGIADLHFHVGVLSLDGWDELGSGGVEALLLSAHLGLGAGHVLSHHGRRHVAGGWGHHLLLAILVVHPLVGSLHRGVASSVVHAHVVAAVLHVGVPVLVRRGRSPLVVVHLLATSTEATLSVGGVLGGELLLHRECLEELGDLEVELVTSGDVVPLGGVVVDLLEALEAQLILGLLVDDVTVLLELVVAD